MNSRVFVTGATGNVGAEVVRFFPEPAQLRLGMINEADRKKAPPGVETVIFDFQNAATFGDAFRDARAMFLLRPPNLANVERDFMPAITAAVRAGVQHIVFLSLVGVENAKFVPHYKIEQAVKASGAAYTFLRASFFMQNLSTTHRAEIRDHHEIALPVGKAKTSFIDVRDLGAVGAKALSEPGHENQAYTLTGGESLDYFEVAAVMADVLGRPIKYTNPNPLSFVFSQKRRGRPWGMTLIMTMLYTMTRNGSADVISGDVQRILGRPPISFHQFAKDNKAVWMPV